MATSNWRDYLLLTIAMFFWGLSWPLAKMLLAYATSFQIGFFRFLIAGAVYVIILFIKDPHCFKRYSLRSFGKFVILGLLGIFGYGILFLTAMGLTTSAQGAVIAGIQPAFIAILAGIFHNDHLSPRWRYFGILFSFAGVVMIIGVQPFLNFDRDQLVGDLIVVVAFVLFASYSVYGRTVMKEYNSFETTAWATFIGMLFFGICAAVENDWGEWQFDSTGFWVPILVLALGTTVVSFFLYFFVIQRIGATKSGIFINLVPVFGTLSSVVLMDEVLNWTLWAGLVLISIGIVLINYPLRSKPKIDEINADSTQIQ